MQPDELHLNAQDTLDGLLIDGIEKRLVQNGCMPFNELIAALVPHPDEKKFTDPNVRRHYVGVIATLLDDLELGGNVTPVLTLRRCKVALEQMGVPTGAYLEQLQRHNAAQVGMYVSSM